MKIIAETCRRLGKTALSCTIENSRVARGGVTRLAGGNSCRLSPADGHVSLISRSAARQIQTLENASSELYDDFQDDEFADRGLTSSTTTAKVASRPSEDRDDYDLYMNTMKGAFDIIHHRTPMLNSFEEPLSLRGDGSISVGGECFDPLAVDISSYRQCGDEYSAGVCGE